MASKIITQLTEGQVAPPVANPHKFAQAMTMLINTPGASTENPAFNATLLGASGAATAALESARFAAISAGSALHSAAAAMASVTGAALARPFIAGTASATTIAQHSTEDQVANQYDKIVEQILSFINSKQAELPSVSLITPASVTVLAQSGYSKKAHIGGESFTLVDAVVGKRGKIILSFKPNEVASYDRAEFELQDSRTKLSGIDALLDLVCPNIFEQLRMANEEKIHEKESAVAEVKMQEYQEYGSW